MDIFERESAEPFGLGNETIDRIHCQCGQMNCNRFADDYDPIVIDGRYFSDYCASNLVFLRIEEMVKGVSIKTKRLRFPELTDEQIATYRLFEPKGRKLR